MLKNAYLLAKIGADTAENEQHFAKILPKTGNYPTGSYPLLLGPGERFALHGFGRRDPLDGRPSWRQNTWIASLGIPDSKWGGGDSDNQPAFGLFPSNFRK